MRAVTKRQNTGATTSAKEMDHICCLRLMTVCISDVGLSTNFNGTILQTGQPGFHFSIPS